MFVDAHHSSMQRAGMFFQCPCSFEDYKKNEKKEVKVDEFFGAEAARKTVQEAMVSREPP